MRHLVHLDDAGRLAATTMVRDALTHGVPAIGGRPAGRRPPVVARRMGRLLEIEGVDRGGGGRRPLRLRSEHVGTTIAAPHVDAALREWLTALDGEPAPWPSLGDALAIERRLVVCARVYEAYHERCRAVVVHPGSPGSPASVTVEDSRGRFVEYHADTQSACGFGQRRLHPAMAALLTDVDVAHVVQVQDRPDGLVAAIGPAPDLEAGGLADLDGMQQLHVGRALLRAPPLEA